MISGGAFVAPARWQRNVEEGHKVEEDFFGWSPPSYDPRLFLNSTERTTFHEKVADVLLRQEELKWDPRKPMTESSTRVFEAVETKLPKILKREILLCCALGTTLDCVGVDGYFLLEGNLLGPVTFDLARSSHWHKLKTLRANGLITPEYLARPKIIRHIGMVTAHRLTKMCRIEGMKSTSRRLW